MTKIHSWIIRLSNIGKEVKFCWVPAHVGVAGNEEADRLAGEAATSNANADRSMVPHKDYYPEIRTKLYNGWQREWSNTPETNKLRSFKESIKQWQSSNQKIRKYEVMLARLRIGHTRLSHGHLMRGEPLPPYCDGCLVPLTVKHILIECPEYIEQRLRNFGVNPNLTTILGESANGNFNINAIITFLTNIGVIQDI